jgi:hypothetical protein
MMASAKKYRVTCSNQLCNNTAMLEGQSDNPYAKKNLAVQLDAKQIPGARSQRLLFRCPKCGNRWHVKNSRLR